MECPSIRQLEYALAVAELRHFGRAARSCHVTQPALSTQIQTLEELLGVRLFERSRRGVLVTAAGEAVLAHARRALRAVDDLVEAASLERAPLSGELRLGVIPTVAPYWLPRWLPGVRRHYAKLRLLLREDQTERLVEGLREGSLDLLLLALPIPGDDLESLALFEEPFVVALPAGHRLTEAAAIAESSLDGESVLLLGDGHCLRDQALAVCRHAGAEEAGVRATSLNTLVQMVANGLGITLLPVSAVPVELRGMRDIVTRPLVPASQRTIGFVWRRASPRAREFELLASELERRPPSGARKLREPSDDPRGRR